jgi:hypothetical protein
MFRPERPIETARLTLPSFSAGDFDDLYACQSRPEPARCLHTIEVADRLAGSLTPLARRQRADPLAFITNRAVFGDLASNERFAAAYRSALASLHQRGAQATLAALAGGDAPAGAR